ncbi:hypothetical protein Ccrd_009180 [Cynara cardunculus var. scolymus]|uniref:Zinc finger, RING/FYVE/PHD-type n=1 Tax=Cynara cardunculus var. scolymus TaxID=59895 RepID=A0A124SIE1_CYNCS|nr:hypothetical protein Ccrd_009180 [Cynara cardunculus var. scolymus]
MSNNQVVKIPRDAISACMTCPICNKLFRDATTIPECLHTCEYFWIIPNSIIRFQLLMLINHNPHFMNHNLQDIRAKIFPSKRRRVKAPEVVPSVTLPLRRKERSLSSLVVSTPRVSTQTTMTGKRSKAAARKKLRGPSFSVEKSNSSTPEPSSDPSPDKETKNGSGPRDGKVDLWKPLNYLVEVANRSKSSKFTSQSSAVKSPPQHTPKSEGHGRKPKGPPLKRSKFQDENGRSDVDVTESAKPKKIRKNRKNKADMLGESDVATLQAALDADANNAPREKRINPIWFHLVPSEEQEGEPLGQIEGSFVRLNERKLTSFLQVELRCMGQPLVPSLLLGNLMELWLQTQPTSQTVSVVIGSSAKEYMMEILYARKGSGLPPSAT